MVSQVDLVLAQLVANGSIEGRLSFLYLFQGGLDLLLETFLEVELVERAERDYWV